MRLVRKERLPFGKKTLGFYEWDGEQITKTFVEGDEHSEWMAGLAARYDLAKRLFGDKWRAKVGLLDL